MRFVLILMNDQRGDSNYQTNDNLRLHDLSIASAHNLSHRYSNLGLTFHCDTVTKWRDNQANINVSSVESESDSETALLYVYSFQYCRITVSFVIYILLCKGKTDTVALLSLSLSFSFSSPFFFYFMIEQKLDLSNIRKI